MSENEKKQVSGCELGCNPEKVSDAKLEGANGGYSKNALGHCSRFKCKYCGSTKVSGVNSASTPIHKCGASDDDARYSTCTNCIHNTGKGWWVFGDGCDVD